MEFIQYNTLTKEKKKVKYPRLDLQPIVGLPENIKYYVTVSTEQPTFNKDLQYLISTEELTTEYYLNYTHLLINKKDWIVKDLYSDINEIRNLKLEELQNLTREISDILNICKNIYIELNPQLIDLINYSRIRLNEVKNVIINKTEISELSNYTIYTDEAHMLISTFKSYII